MANLPYIPAPFSPQTSVQAASTGASMGNLAADNRLRAAQMAQQSMQFSQQLALSRMAQEAEQAQKAEQMEIQRETLAEEMRFKAQEAAAGFQNRLDVARVTEAGRRAVQQDEGDSAIRILQKKHDLKLAENEANRQAVMKQLGGAAEGADPELLLNPQRKTAAEKSLLSLKVREAGITSALERAKSSPSYVADDPELVKMQRALDATTAQRQFLERSLGRVKKSGAGPWTLIDEGGKAIPFQDKASLDAAVEGMQRNAKKAEEAAAPILTFNLQENRYD